MPHKPTESGAVEASKPLVTSVENAVAVRAISGTLFAAAHQQKLRTRGQTPV